MSDNNEKMQKNSESLMRQILYFDPKKVDLKFIFDHVRNYGIAATVMVTGVYLAKNPVTSSSFVPSNISSNFVHHTANSFIPNFDIIIAAFLICFGFALNVLNLLQAVLVLAKLKMNMMIYFLFSLLLFSITGKFFGASIRQLVNW